MRKVQFFAVFWTLVIAIPFTALAISAVAYLTENMGQITRSLTEFSQSSSVGGRGILVELSARWPEIAGMVIGQLVILTILLFARKNQHNVDADLKH
jgi:hypothetical protein